MRSPPHYRMRRPGNVMGITKMRFSPTRAWLGWDAKGVARGCTRGTPGVATNRESDSLAGGGAPPFGFGDAHRSHELDRKTERLSPKTMIGRRMSQDEAKRLMTA